MARTQPHSPIITQCPCTPQTGAVGARATNVVSDVLKQLPTSRPNTWAVGRTRFPFQFFYEENFTKTKCQHAHNILALCTAETAQTAAYHGSEGWTQCSARALGFDCLTLLLKSYEDRTYHAMSLSFPPRNPLKQLPMPHPNTMALMIDRRVARITSPQKIRTPGQGNTIVKGRTPLNSAKLSISSPNLCIGFSPSMVDIAFKQYLSFTYHFRQSCYHFKKCSSRDSRTRKHHGSEGRIGAEAVAVDGA